MATHDFFEFATATRIVFGSGAVTQIGQLVNSFGAKVFLVIGKTKSRAQIVLDILTQAKVETYCFEVGEEPTTEIVIRGIQVAKAAGSQVVVSFGGGSVIDAGKAIAAMLTNPGELMDYLEVVGKGKVLQFPSLPFIAIPTTSGTGAEVTKNAVLCSSQHKQKVSLRSAHMFPKVALVDPELTISVSSVVTASTGLDAFTQVLESFVSNKSNPLTDALCREGLKRGARALKRAYEHGDDKLAREDMAITSLFGGLALANSKLGAVHGVAGPLGGMFATAPHGAVCACLLPHVFEINVQALQQRDPNGPYLKRFDEVAQIITGNAQASSVDAVVWIKQLCKDLKVPPLTSYGVRKEDFKVIADKSATSSSMQGNPIKLTTEELIRVLELSFVSV